MKFLQSPTHRYSLYALTIFLSAFLLFQVQPLIGRHLLPWFGGSTSVWGTSLVFFTAMLFLGYAYAYFISRLPYAKQAKTHLKVIIAACIIVVAYVCFFQSPYPPLTWTIGSTMPPVLGVLLALTIMIGIPYFLLSTTGPLVQYWYGVKEGQEPYRLYVLSNLGSFIALGTYPFVIEPSFTLSFQSQMWTVLFLFLAAFYGLITYNFHRSVKEKTLAHSAENTRDDSVIPRSTRLQWIAFAALPAALMVAVTSQLTQVVAPIPFLWVLPLALYLLSFILAFRGWGGGGLTGFVVVVLSALVYSHLGWGYEAVTRQLLSYVGLFFFASLYFHAQLYASRPGAPHAALFYLYTSLGGVVGTAIVSLIAPLVFNDLLEFPLGIMVAALSAVICFPAMRYIRDAFEKHTAVIRALMLFVIASVGIYYAHTSNQGYFLLDRNFYGVVKLYEGDGERKLYHGTTLHGKQFLDKENALQATTYYGAGSGVGRAIIHKAIAHRKGKDDTGFSVGAIGLGTGTLAAYCGKNDRFIFYEIDARVERIARDYFTYLEHCEGVQVKIGDGRKLLEEERRAGDMQKFDVLAVDAFSDDTIPAHLLTKESVEIYVEHLRDEKSILVIHTSNRYLELDPVVTRIAEELGLTWMVVNDGGEEKYGVGLTSSEWVMLAKDPAVLKDAAFADAGTVAQKSETPPSPLWTDDYMNVLAALDLPMLYSFDSE